MQDVALDPDLISGYIWGAERDASRNDCSVATLQQCTVTQGIFLQNPKR